MNAAFLILFGLLQVADIHTTLKALELGKREANPFLAKLFTKYDPLAVMVITKAVAVWLLWYVDAWLITMACCALYVWVVINNWKVVRS